MDDETAAAAAAAADDDDDDAASVCLPFPCSSAGLRAHLFCSNVSIQLLQNGGVCQSAWWDRMSISSKSPAVGGLWGCGVSQFQKIPFIKKKKRYGGSSAPSKENERAVDSSWRPVVSRSAMMMKRADWVWWVVHVFLFFEKKTLGLSLMGSGEGACFGA
jgi:hypothetical protein